MSERARKRIEAQSPSAFGLCDARRSDLDDRTRPALSDAPAAWELEILLPIARDLLFAGHEAEDSL